MIRLVYVEQHVTILDAIAREKALKRRKRSWKLNPIGAANPDRVDLYDALNG